MHGLTAAQAAWSPEAGRNSIWRIVHHLTIWKEYFAGRLAGGPVEPPGWAKGIDWAPVPEPTEEAWEAARQRLLRAHDARKAELAKHCTTRITAVRSTTSARCRTSRRGDLGRRSVKSTRISHPLAWQANSLRSELQTSEHFDSGGLLTDLVRSLTELPHCLLQLPLAAAEAPVDCLVVPAAG